VGSSWFKVLFTPVGTSNAEKPKWREMSHVLTILMVKWKEDLSQTAVALLAFPEVPLPSVTAQFQSATTPSPLSLFPLAQPTGPVQLTEGAMGNVMQFVEWEHLNTYNKALRTKTGATSLQDAFTVPTDRTSHRLADFSNAYFQQSKFPLQHTYGFLERSILSLLKDQEQFEVMAGIDQKAIQGADRLIQELNEGFLDI
jgi:hypothetical protein